MLPRDKIVEELKKKKKMELIKIFEEEVRLTEQEKKLLASYYALYCKVTAAKKEVEKKNRTSEIRKLDDDLRRVKFLLEKMSDLQKLVDKYRTWYDKTTKENLGNAQIRDEDLIDAIVAVRELRAKIKLSYASSHRPSSYGPSSYGGAASPRTRRYSFPHDWAGYRQDRYPSTVGLDPTKIRCRNCRHWLTEKQFCLIHRKRTNPNYRCNEFGRRGL